MKDHLNPKALQKIMERAVVIDKNCEEQCREFTIMTSPMRKETLILQWLTIDISDIDRPIQKYEYECFYLDGTSQNCGVNYDSQEEANRFFKTLKPLYKQLFAKDLILFKTNEDV